ncbi:MAG: Hsp33 family molecular chaperone [Pseudomonadota bacterium]
MAQSQDPEYTDDFILPFQVGDGAVRGRIIRLADAIDDILAPHAFPPEVAALAGETACLVSLCGAALKFDGRLILQAQGAGPAHMVVADYASDGALRATAQFDEEALAGLEAPRSAGALLGKGHIAMTVDQGPDMERYQGVTPLEGDTMAAIGVGYFAQSEQIPTALKLAVGRIAAPGETERWRAGGVMAQLTPAEGGVRGAPSATDPDDEESWLRAAAFIDTIADDELLDPAISAERLLYRLFHEDGVRVFDPQPVRAQCRCNSDKIAAVLGRYDADTLGDMTEADGAVHVTCEFCRKNYRFSTEGEFLDVR